MRRERKPKAFFIHVNPVGSKFAKAIQQAVQTKTSRRVLRTGRAREALRTFSVTTNPLNKIEQFSRFSRSEISCPKFTTNPGALDSLDSKTIFARTLVNSTNGRGIVEFELGDVAPRAPLYTAYIPKKAEYRFHVFGDKVIDVQEKRKKRGFNEDDRNTRVRNVNNGYVYCRDGINPPNGASDLAIRAVQALGYKYGAVDIIYNEKRNQSYVLEVNSRPGLMGTTVEKYAEALINMYSLEKK